MLSFDPEMAAAVFNPSALAEDRRRLWMMLREEEPVVIAHRLGRSIEAVEALYSELRAEFGVGT